MGRESGNEQGMKRGAESAAGAPSSLHVQGLGGEGVAR